MANKGLKETWIVTVHNRKSGIDNLTCIEMHFRRVVIQDAALEVANAVRAGSDTDYYTRKASEVRKATDSTVYYHDMWHNSELDLSFQANNSGECSGYWYGGRICDAQIDDHVAKAITKLVKLGRDLTPAQAIEALKALPARYLSEIHDFVPASMSELLNVPGSTKEG